MTATAPVPAPLRRPGSSRRTWWVVPCLVLLGAAATLEAAGQPAAAAAVHLGLVLLLCLPVAGPPDQLRTVLVGVCVVRVVCLATPLPSASAVTRTAALGVGAWLVVALVWRAVERPAPSPHRRDRRRGEPWRWDGTQRRVALSGVPVGIAAYLAAPSTGGTASTGGIGGAWVVLVLAALSTAMVVPVERGPWVPVTRRVRVWVPAARGPLVNSDAWSVRVAA